MNRKTERKAKKATVTAQLRMVERWLQVWDSVGVIRDQAEAGVPPTEYDSYAPKVLALLHQGCSADELAQHLASVRSGPMGLKRDSSKDHALAEGLLAWWTNKGARMSPDV
jgi:hypothetical protein